MLMVGRCHTVAATNERMLMVGRVAVCAAVAAANNERMLMVGRWQRGRFRMTEWFSKKQGDGVSVSIDDPSMVLIGDQTPDWVRLPDELGGATLRVLDSIRAECPMCEDGVPTRHLHCHDHFGVAECERHGFVWYRMTPP